MDYREPITTEEQYAAAKARMAELKDARFGTPEGEELDCLHLNTHQYECERGDYEHLREKEKGFDLWYKWYEAKRWINANVPGAKWVSEAWYWLRSHTVMRRHVIDISRIDGIGTTTRQGYTWGWIDADHRLLLACFEVFRDFYEDEYPGHVLWQPTVDREMRELYEWWTKGRHEEVREAHRLLKEGTLDDGSIFGGWKSEEAREAWRKAWEITEEKPAEMVKRLIAISGYLWT